MQVIVADVCRNFLQKGELKPGGGELPEGGRGFDRDICLFNRQLGVCKLLDL